MGKNNIILNTRGYGLLIIMSLFFTISLIYFTLFGYHIFNYQEKQILFIWNREYLLQFFSKPGGALVWAGNFLTQFSFYPFAGAVILASLLTCFLCLCYRIAEYIYGKGHLLQAISILPACILLILQSDYNSQVYITGGFVLVLAFFLFVLKQQGRAGLLSGLLFFPVVYFISGSFAWIFAGVQIIHSIVNRKFLMSFILISEGALLLFLSKEYIFYQSLSDLLIFPAGLHGMSLTVFYILSCLLIFYPAALNLLKKIPATRENISPYLIMMILSATLFGLSRLYNPEISGLFRVEELAQKEKWDELISYQEKTRSRNIVAQYYYNLALSETDQLCNRMFSAPQDFGPGSLMVQWDSGTNINQIYRGVYFFYSIGLINEAHRWAYESMVMQGYRPENLRMLIKTELIRGNFRVAEKYIGILKKTLFYKAEAAHYEKMSGNPELVKADTDLGEKSGLGPVTDFLVRLRDQQANVLLLLRSNPSNRRAFEYMMAWYMLERNPAMIESEIQGMKFLGYDKTPKHIEEAILYQASRSGRSLESDIKISSETRERYMVYKEELRRRGTVSITGAGGGKTFWSYIDKI